MGRDAITSCLCRLIICDEVVCQGNFPKDSADARECQQLLEAVKAVLYASVYAVLRNCMWAFQVAQLSYEHAFSMPPVEHLRHLILEGPSHNLKFEALSASPSIETLSLTETEYCRELYKNVFKLPTLKHLHISKVAPRFC